MSAMNFLSWSVLIGACSSRSRKTHSVHHPLAFHALVQGNQGAGQVRQRPVKVGAARLLQHLLEGADGHCGDRHPHQVADECRVLAQVARHGEHRLGGSDRVVEPAWATSARNRTCKALASERICCTSGSSKLDPIRLELQQDLPVGIVEPGGPVGLAQRVPAVFLQLLRGQLLERHGQQLLAVLKSLLRRKRISSAPCMHFM